MDPATAVQLGLGAIQTVSGLIGQGRARRRMNELQSQRRAYQTPDEVFQILQATQQNAQSGLGAETLRYLTGQNDRALSTSINSANLLGGDANDLGALLERAMQQTSAIGGQDAAMRMEQFGKYLGAVNTVVQNKDAEYQSRENLLKDQIQAASAQGANATQNLQSGINAGLGALTANSQMNLFNTQNDNNRALLDYLNSQGITYPTLDRMPTTRSTNNSTTITPRSN